MDISLKKNIRFWSDSFIHSYSQMFFSDNRIFAYLILVASFANVHSGIAGFIAVISSIFFSHWLGLNRTSIHSGFYSFNSLMVGLVMGLFFQFSFIFFLLLFIFSITSVLITNAIGIFFAKYELPVLGIPFILTVWLLLLAVRGLNEIQLSERWLFVYNDLFSIGGIQMVKAYEWMQEIRLPGIIDIYFKSLGAIYFQYNVIAGILIAIGLLIYSRIAFSLSIIGFISGYYAFYFLHGNVEQLSYTYIGFNYILAAISIGGFYLIPSAKSYVLAVLLTAVIAVIQTGMGYLLGLLQLPMYSFPSTIIILLTLLTLKYRFESKGLKLVPVQLFSPEKNLYRYLYQSERYKNNTYIQIALPFYGEWYVSQGNDGKITHRDDWKYALDFVVVDEMKKTFRLPGEKLSDFFCYNIPVNAPAAGYVTHIIDDIEDNNIGEVNLQQNWGNTIIIRHAEGLYSKLSHMKQASFKVKVGDYVNAGDIIAACGNSGRSPEPHIHFQLQSTPFVGSKTLQYPISYYVTRKNGFDYEFHSFDYPREQSDVSNIQRTQILLSAFNFEPGQKLKFEVITKEEAKEKKEIISWEVKVDSYNYKYLYCAETNSSAYFINNFTVFYFTEFYGDKKSLLYQFFISAHKILLGYYHQMNINDELPLNSLFSGMVLYLQDFTAPFIRFVKADYNAVFSVIDDFNFPKFIKIETQASIGFSKKNLKVINSEIVINNGSIQYFTIENGNTKILATCLSD